jgi:anti-sigma factor RsiW
MEHAGDGQLLALMDGQLSAAEEAAVRSHLRSCPACAQELDALREASALLSASLRVLDAAAPAPKPVVRLVVRAGGARVAAVRRTLLRAAGIVLVLAGGGAAALPGSPVREWARAAWERGKALFGGAEPAATVQTPAAAASIGIDAAPVAGRIRVSLVAMRAGTQVRVRLVDRPVAWIEAEQIVGAAPQFVRGSGRVEVVGGVVRRLRIDLPRDVARAEVEVDGRVRVRKDGEVLRLATAGREEDSGPQAEFVIGD